MTETQKRINAYRKALPHMKERVTAVALLLVIAITMMTSATFAWMTLSRSPEASSILTTVTTNGNLEIALSGTDGKLPRDTAVGDGGRDITLTNLTWGNLINLSSDKYGLDALTLRPASLNSSDLIRSPLYAVQYGDDGRVLGYFTDFSFSNYNPDLGTFGVPSTGMEYGVRAVSSVTYKDAAGETFFKNQMKEINQNAANAKNIFNGIIGNKAYMSAISALVGIHVSVTLEDKDISCVQYIDSLVGMITEFQESVDAVGQTMVEIANLHLYINEYRETPELYSKNKYKLEDLKASSYNNTFVTKYESIVDGLDAYVTLAKKTEKAYNGIIAAKAVHTATGNVYWKADLEDYANLLCNMTTATLDGKTVSQLSNKNSIMSTVSMLFDGKVHQAMINDGALKDLDQMLGAPTMVVKNIPISVKVPKSYAGINIPIFGGTTQTLNVDVTTGASMSTEYVLPEDVKEAEDTVAAAAGVSYKGQAVAADTYAMAIDFWVRTNEENTLLILEGKYKYREDVVPVYGTDASGLQVPLYTYVESEDARHDVYKVETTDENGEKVTTWYFAADHSELTAERLAGATPTPQTEIKKVVIGYEGVNRVWDELDDPNSNAAQQIPENGISTTQGSGSCYIFYPESPEDQERCKRLLSAMRVAFVNEAGDLLGEAIMDTENIIEDAGRVLVPLQMSPQAPIVVGEDENGEAITRTDYIIPMTQNKAVRITAVVYLDGTNLSNSDVLAAGSINGQLNIQFGTSQMELDPMDNMEIMGQYYTLEWHNNNSNNRYYFDYYNEDTCKIDLKLLLEGSQPSSIKGNFISYISATQGASEDVFELVLGDDGFWSATVPFSGPGNYKLRSLQIDGVDIALDEDMCIEVEIEGVKINSLTCYGWDVPNEQSLMTAQNVYSQRLIMSLSTNQGSMPAIQAVFLGDNGKTVTANFTKVGESYEGTANFTSSGTYKMTYVIVDGVYTPIDEELYKTLSIRLGLRANVIVNQPVNQKYLDLAELLAAATIEDEAAEIQKQMDALLQELHYGNGIVGDENEKGLQLQQTNGNWYMVHDGGEHLFMDVSCIILDDQGQALKNLGNVEIFYTAGSETNRLTSGVKWNASTERYEGAFELEKSFGLYRFEKVVIGGEANTITAATAAPTITSIAPTPMSPVRLPAYEDLIRDLSASSKREMYITLEDAPAAILSVTLQKGTGDSATTVTKTIDSYTSEQPFGNRMRYTFAIPIDSDGQWELTGVKVCNVFYNGFFYSGGDDAANWLDLDLNGDKKLDELVEDGQTATYFLTDVELYANRTPASKDVEFMSSNTCNDMYITVSNQGRPLADVLKELAEDEKFSKYNVQTDVLVYMKYTWLQKMTEWTVDDESKLPVREFGGELTMNTTPGDTYGRYELGNMNFLVDGKYTADFRLTIGGTVCETLSTVQAAGIQTAGSAISLETAVTIAWKKPVVKITQVTDATKDSLDNPKFTINLATDQSRDNTPFVGVQNYFEDYYANVFISGEEGSYSCPTVTMTMESGAGAATNRYFIVYNNANSSYNRTYSFSGNGATSTAEIGHEDSFWWVLDTSYTRYQAGKTIVDNINMEYGDTMYHLQLSNAITVNQQHIPLYLTLNADLTQVDMPAQIAAENVNKKAFKVSTDGAASVTIVSPDGRAFAVTLPRPTRVIENRYDDQLTSAIYDNELGYPVDTYVYTYWTETEGSGCNAKDVTYYQQYQVWERKATMTGTRDVYTDTYAVEDWSGGKSGAQVTVSATSTFTAGEVTMTSVKTNSLTLQGNTVTQYKHVTVGNKTQTIPAGTPVTSVQTEYTG